MKIMEFVILACASAVVVASARADEPLSDEAVRQGVIKFLMPRCGGGNVDGNEPPDPELTDFAKYRNFGHVSLDDSIQSVDPTYHASKRRLDVLRAAQNRCGNSFQLDYVTNAINELVAYPESDLPD